MLMMKLIASDRRRRSLLISLIQLDSMRDVSARRWFANCAY